MTRARRIQLEHTAPAELDRVERQLEAALVRARLGSCHLRNDGYDELVREGKING